jgi:hypothetical protein
LLGTTEFSPDVIQLDSLPEHVGPYRIRGALRSTALERVLLGYDSQLGRTVWIWMRPVGEPVLGESFRAVNRMTRVRWVACGTRENEQWDAFLTPTGCPLSAWVERNGPLSWAEFRPLWEELAEELQNSCKEHSLPPSLSADQIWISPAGHLQLIGTKSDPQAGPTAHPAADEHRALTCLRNVASLMLEGPLRSVDCQAKAIQAPIPLHGAKVLNRLWAEPGLPPDQPPYVRVEELRADLLATQDEPVAVTRWARAKHLVGQGVYSLLGMLFLSGFVLLLGELVATIREATGFDLMAWPPIVIAVLLFFGPAYLGRGGVSFLRAGIAIVLADGRQASRLRCLVRALLAWTVVAVLGLVTWVGVTFFTFPWSEWIVPGTAAALLAAYVSLMIRSPSRAPHDHVTKTYLVPR